VALLCANWAETEVAASTACEVAVTSPTVTLSAYTLPDAPELSPYEIFQVYPDLALESSAW